MKLILKVAGPTIFASHIVIVVVIVIVITVLQFRFGKAI